MARGSAKKRRQKRQMAAVNQDANADLDNDTSNPSSGEVEANEGSGDAEEDKMQKPDTKATLANSETLGENIDNDAEDLGLDEDENDHYEEDDSQGDVKFASSASNFQTNGNGHAAMSSLKVNTQHENAEAENSKKQLPSTPIQKHKAAAASNKLQGLTPEARTPLESKAGNPLSSEFVGSIASAGEVGLLEIPELPAISRSESKDSTTASATSQIDPSQVKPLTSPVSMASRFVQPGTSSPPSIAHGNAQQLHSSHPQTPQSPGFGFTGFDPAMARLGGRPRSQSSNSILSSRCSPSPAYEEVERNPTPPFVGGSGFRGSLPRRSRASPVGRVLAHSQDADSSDRSATNGSANGSPIGSPNDGMNGSPSTGHALRSHPSSQVSERGAEEIVNSSVSGVTASLRIPDKISVTSVSPPATSNGLLPASAVPGAGTPTARYTRADSTMERFSALGSSIGGSSAGLAMASADVLSQSGAAAVASSGILGGADAEADGLPEDEAAAAAAAALPEDDFIRYFVKEDDPNEDLDTNNSVRFFDWVWQDLGFETEEEQAFSAKNASVEDDVFNFIRVPLEVEKLLIFGFFLCCDSLLFMLVYLPLRVVRAAFLLVCTLVLPSKYGSKFKFHRTQLYDLLRASIIAIAFYALLQVHMSRIYHYVRGQAFIKLYVIFNMLDIFDRLMCSFGQDIMDSLFYMTKTSPRAYGPIFFRFILGTCYVTLHALLYFVRLITLNAAINSTSNALMTILISNNFVELKGSVFKRFAEQNLFQITCSDMVERFELFVFLLLTGLQSSDTWLEFLYSSAMYVFVCEFLVDWVKHAFITKFNRIHFSCYGNFLEALCRDIAPVGNHKHPYATSQRLGGRPVDATQAVAQRIGLATLPLTCIVLRFAFVNMPYDLRENPFTVPNVLFVLLTYGCLLTFKTFINIMLKGRACAVLMYRERKILRRSSPRLSSLPSTPTEKELQKALVAKHLQHIDQLSSIRRYQIFKSRVPT